MSHLAPHDDGGHDRLVPVFSAIIAVLAALGTLFSHHRSIQALAQWNQEVLTTAKATDQFQYYQTQQIKITMYQGLISEKTPSQAAQVKALRESLDKEQRATLGVYQHAKDLEKQAEREDDRAAGLLRSFETLEIATTLFEISIVFASIAALTGARPMLWIGATLSLIGVVTGLYGYFQAH